MSILIPPYGGRLVDLRIQDPEERIEEEQRAASLPSAQLSVRSVCDLELLATGAFSPLDRFMSRADYERVLGEMRLENGLIFPIPVTLPIAPAPLLKEGREIALRSPRGEILATMVAQEVFQYDRQREASQVYGTHDVRHPLVAEMESWGTLCVSGPLRVLSVPRYYDFPKLRQTPSEVRRLLEALGRSNVVAFQTRNPLHRAHEWITKKAGEQINGSLLIHPVVGLTKPGDIDHYTRVRGYKEVVKRYYDASRTVLALLPLAMRFAGPREAVWHAVVRRNYGANFFIVGRDHASPGKDSKGKAFYDPHAAQELLASLEREVGVQVIPFREVVFLPDEDRYEELHRVPEGRRAVALSGSEVREKLARSEPLPEWFTRPEVARLMMEANQVRRPGFCVWLTGLPCAGKSTIAELLASLLVERARTVTLLDGDVVRTHLSKGLGFSREDRDANVLRLAYVASEIVRHGGVAIVAAVSPYRSARNQARTMVGEEQFVLVHVATPVDVCEARDRKGLYARARRGELSGVTGINDPYESPVGPEVVLDGATRTPEEYAEEVLRYLVTKGLMRGQEFIPA